MQFGKTFYLFLIGLLLSLGASAQNISIATGGTGVTAAAGDSMRWPAATQASSPPASGRTRVRPRSASRRAALAAEASFGQLQ